MTISLSDIVNLNEYPIHDLNSKIYKELTEYCKNELDTIGCCVLSNFVQPNSINKIPRCWPSFAVLARGL